MRVDVDGLDALAADHHLAAARCAFRMRVVQEFAADEGDRSGRTGCTVNEIASRLDSRVHIEASLTALFGACTGSIGEFNGGNKAPPARSAIEARYCAVMPAVLITFPHFAISLSI